MPFLIFRHLEKRTSWHVSAEGESLTIGGSPAATVTVTDAWLAAREIAIHKRGEDFHLEDLSGRRRVLVNGRATSASTLRTGDRVRLGAACMLFISETRPSDAQIAQLESLLDRELAAPERVRESLEAALSSDGRPWRVLLAVCLCGLSLGVVVGIVVAQLMD